MEFSKGNKKIGKDTIIFNMGPASSCPSDALGLCKLSDKCYAKKAERQYHHCVPQYRERQLKAWIGDDEETIFDEIRSKTKNARKHHIKYVRFNESGDFWSQACIEKMKRLCELLLEDEVTKKIVVYGYTNRRDLKFENLPINMIVNGTNNMISNEFIPVPEEEIEMYENVCPQKCEGCMKCKEANGARIYIAIH